MCTARAERHARRRVHRHAAAAPCSPTAGSRRPTPTPTPPPPDIASSSGRLRCGAERRPGGALAAAERGSIVP